MKDRARYWGLAAGVALLPGVMTTVLLGSMFGATLLDFKPHYSDEAHYWHETLTFVTHGFAGGYYVWDERPARAAFTPFGPHGPGFPVAYGLLGAVIGWRWWSGVVLNLVLITVALVVFIRLTRPDPRQLTILGAYLAVSAPVVLMLPSNMQESLHQAIAIVLAAMFCRLLGREGGLSPWWTVGSGVGIAAGALVRATWALLFIPLAVLALPARSARRVLAALAGGTLLAGAFFVLLLYWAAPAVTGYGLRSRLDGHPLEHLQRVLIVVLLAAVGGELIRRRGAGRGAGGGDAREAWFQLASLGLVSVAYFVTGQVTAWRDFRGLAPFLLMGSLLMIGLRRRLWFVGLSIALGLAFGPSLLAVYGEFRGPEFVVDRRAVQTARERLAGLLAYRSNPNRWCNTVLVGSARFQDMFVAIPAGIGVSYISDPARLTFPLKSRYLLLDEAGYHRLRDRLDARLLGTTNLGAIYLNLAARCDDQSSSAPPRPRAG